jgi:hypothetical protein
MNNQLLYKFTMDIVTLLLFHVKKTCKETCKENVKKACIICGLLYNRKALN